MLLAALVVILWIAGAVGARCSDTGPGTGRELDSVRGQIGRLERELAELKGRERGVLGELERLAAEIRLREAQLREVGLRLAGVEAAILERESRLEQLAGVQSERRRYLSFRLREIYKQGPGLQLRRMLGGDGDIVGFMGRLRYAGFLNARDARILGEYLDTASRIEAERESLVAERDDLRRVGEEAESARRTLTGSRELRSRQLRALQTDQSRRRAALSELEDAARRLQGLVDRVVGDTASSGPDITMFRGLLDRPADGLVTSGFGEVVHPRFKTVVPHPGLDIAAREGTPFRSVFGGTVVFASWLRGYGLTAIIDHGSGVLSVYAHASVLMVGENDPVVRGQELGRVGDTGSLKGPFLYFELRRGGKPVDPTPWFRKP